MQQSLFGGAAVTQHKLYTTPRTWHEHIYHKPARGPTPHGIRDILSGGKGAGAGTGTPGGVGVGGVVCYTNPYGYQDEGPQDLVVRSPPKLVPFSGAGTGRSGSGSTSPGGDASSAGAPRHHPGAPPHPSRLVCHNRCDSPPINVTDDAEHTGMRLLINYSLITT